MKSQLVAAGKIPSTAVVSGPGFFFGAAGGSMAASGPVVPAPLVVAIPIFLFYNAFEFQEKIKVQRVFDGPTSALFTIKANTNIFRNFCASLHLQYIHYMGREFTRINGTAGATADMGILCERTKKFNNDIFKFTPIQIPNTTAISWVAMTFKDSIVAPVIEREYNGSLPDTFFEGRNVEGSRLMFNVWLSIKADN
jgi:hypothetical protein